MALDNKQNMIVGKSFHQDSSFRQVTGSAAYIDDIPLPKNCLHGALVLSDIASGTITSMDLREVRKLDFSCHVITAKDIPGKNDIAPIFSDEPILADKNVTYIGQPIALVLASTMEKARLAARKVKIKIKEKKNPILNLETAFKLKSFFLNPILFIN